MGVMVGGEAGGTAIGVAPGATWIAVKALNDARSGAESIILQGFQWLLDLPPQEAPDVVNNSWGFPNVNGCNTIFQAAIDTLQAAGIEMVFSAGNSGPAGSTSVSPANNAGVLAVGATDSLNNVAYFSSRGPSACNGGLFPQVVAPGANIRTAAPTAGGTVPVPYTFSSGTSFSSPHVAGAAALLLDAFPTLSISQVEALLESTTNPAVGAPFPNNNYGHGLIDTVSAYQSAFSALKGNVPEIASSPSSRDFGVAEISAGGSETFTLFNRGLVGLGIADITVTGRDSSDFLKPISGDNCSGQILPPFSSCTVSLQFSPVSVGGGDAALSIQSDDPAHASFNIPLHATTFAVLPGGTVSSPAIAWNTTAQTLQIAARGAQGDKIWLSSADSGGVFNNDWFEVPGTTLGTPAIAWDETSQKLYVAIRTVGNKILVGSVNSSGGFNDDWTQLPGGTQDAPAIAWNQTDQKLHIAVRGGHDDTIWVGSLNSSGAFNNDWTQLPGGTLNAPALAWSETAQKLFIVVRGRAGGKIWVGSLNSSGAFNDDWTSLPGGTPNAPAIAWSQTAQKLYIVVRGGAADKVWIGSVGSNGTFNDDWTTLDGTSPSGPSAVFNPLTEELHILLRKADNKIEEWATR